MALGTFGRGGGGGAGGHGPHADMYDPGGGVDTVSPGETGAMTPGSTFDASDVER